MPTSIRLGESPATLGLTADATPIAVPLTELTSTFNGVITYYLGVYVSGALNVSVLPSATTPTHTAHQIATLGWATFGPLRVVDGPPFLYATGPSVCRCTLTPVMGEGRG